MRSTVGANGIGCKPIAGATPWVTLCVDRQAYRAFLDGRLVNYEYPEERVADALAQLPVVC